MPVIEFKLAVVLMLALFQFSLGAKEISVEMSTPGQSSELRLIRAPRGYYITDSSAADSPSVGFITTFDDDPMKFQFGEPGMNPSIRLENLIQDFSKLDFSRQGLILTCTLDGSSETLEYSRTDRSFHVADLNSGTTFTVYPESD